MAKKVTLETIDQKLDYALERLNKMEQAENLNTEFRLQAKGIVSTVAFVSSVFGGIILWLFQKVSR